MGGYGALKWALHHPERFAAAASLSGALDLVALAALPDRRDELRGRVFGGAPGPDDDLFDLLRRADPAALPSLYLACGTEDHLVEGNRRFVDALHERGVDHESVFRPGGHEWDFWDAEIEKVISWLPLGNDH